MLSLFLWRVSLSDYLPWFFLRLPSLIYFEFLECLCFVGSDVEMRFWCVFLALHHRNLFNNISIIIRPYKSDRTFKFFFRQTYDILIRFWNFIRNMNGVNYHKGYDFIKTDLISLYTFDVCTTCFCQQLKTSYIPCLLVCLPI